MKDSEELIARVTTNAINVVNDLGCMALHRAAELGSDNNVKLLLEYRAGAAIKYCLSRTL
jgi:hypothetical protein